MKFDSAEHVADYFNLPPFTPDQWLLIENYIQFGHIPLPDGCMGCDAAYIRTIIGQMQAAPEPQVSWREPEPTDDPDYHAEHTYWADNNETDPEAPFTPIFSDDVEDLIHDETKKAKKKK